jgi:hypothetical protein
MKLVAGLAVAAARVSVLSRNPTVMTTSGPPSRVVAMFLA